MLRYSELDPELKGEVEDQPILFAQFKSPDPLMPISQCQSIRTSMCEKLPDIDLTQKLGSVNTIIRDWTRYAIVGGDLMMWRSVKAFTTTARALEKERQKRMKAKETAAAAKKAKERKADQSKGDKSEDTETTPEE